MHPSPKTLLIAAIVLVASVAIAQEATPSADAALMGRLSYDNSGFVQPGSVMHVCFAVYKDGGYRIVRSFNDGHTQRLHGNMPNEEFRGCPICWQRLSSEICRAMVVGWSPGS
jgi:hypothetical protein